MQATSILPALKDRGYHITFYTTPALHEVLRTDPHVDAFVVQDVDLIPNEQLGDFWRATAKKYDKFVNLSESVERTLLAMPGNMNHTWSHEMRHKHLNKNYMEFVHDIAGVPMPARIRFHATDSETEWARKEKGDGFVILWVLSGSAVHKVWPYQDEAIDKVLQRYPEARFVLVGDADCKVLEVGWGKVERVRCRSGEWSIRQTLAFAQVADLVIGPETGVMNGVSMWPVEKIVLLSHSSVQNLTRDWVNCTSLYPIDTKCYPCHKLHLMQDGFKYCNEVDGVARCQADIPAKMMLDAIDKKINYRKAA